MTLPAGFTATTEAIKKELGESSSGSKRLKLRTLLAKYGYSKRSDANTGMITSALADWSISINPPIVRFGSDWEIATEDWIYLGDTVRAGLADHSLKHENTPSDFWREDPWFEKIAGYELRTEKEVEIKFIVPLLKRLGYGDDDRFDGMPIPAAHGSRDTTLVIDFALFDSSVEELVHQPLLVVEAKHESRLRKREEILKAHNQAKSYCLWTQCDYFMVTDSRTVLVFHIARGNLKDLSPLFSCERQELKERFGELHQLVSRDALSRIYLAKLGTTEEAK